MVYTKYKKKIILYEDNNKTITSQQPSQWCCLLHNQGRQTEGGGEDWGVATPLNFGWGGG